MEVNEIATLISTAPPPFVFVHDPVCLRDTTSALESALISEANSTAHVQHVVANGISCFAPRLLYDHVINSLADWSVEWPEGCANWSLPSSSGRWNDSLDSFTRGLRTLHSHIRRNRTNVSKAESNRKTREIKGKRKQRQVEGNVEEVRFAIIIEHAERLRNNMPDLLVPLTRLAELTRLDLTVVFISQVRWEDMKPPLGASLDPYFIDIPPPKKEQIVKRLEENFDFATKSMTTPSRHTDTSKPRRGRSRNISTGDQDSSSSSLPRLYHPSLRQLHNDFISILCDVCYPFIHDPREIQYIAAARWPGFVQPVLDEHNQRLRRRAGRAGRQPEDMAIDEEYSDDEDEDDEDENLRPPPADTRLRLGRLFKPTLTSALEDLYPRITNAAAWAELNSTPPDLDSIPLSRPLSPVKPGADFGHNVDLTTLTPQTPRRTRSLRSSAPNTPHTPHTPYTPRTPRAASYTHTYAGDRNDSRETGLSALPRLSKFILIAAFLASTNPSKSDLRMFGRGLDEKKRRKRRASSTKTGNGLTKVPQRLLGPTPFPFDRLVAILGSLLEENDIDGDGSRAPADDMFHAPGEHTDMEMTRVGVYTAVVELASMWLLHRTSPADKFEGPPMFKCGISYEDTLGLAKDLDVPLNDLLWDSV